MNSAVIDACVLYSAFLRDLTMRLTVSLVFQPKWTEQIHEEWMRNVLLNRPDLKREALERTRVLMNQWGKDCLVTNYEPHIATLTLPDVKDRHVLAAAIQSESPTIVTFNISDFPATTLAEHHIRAIHPDAFFSSLFEEDAELFLSAVKIHRASLKQPSRTAEEYVESLKRNRLESLARHLSLCQQEI